MKEEDIVKRFVIMIVLFLGICIYFCIIMYIYYVEVFKYYVLIIIL